MRKLEAEIKLEEDTIDLLKADWALLTQPNRLEEARRGLSRAICKLVPTESTQLAQPERAADAEGRRTAAAAEAGGRTRGAKIAAATKTEKTLRRRRKEEGTSAWR